MNDLDRQIQKLSKKLGQIASRDVLQSVATSLNKTANHTKGRTVKGVSKQLSVQQKIIRKKLFVSRATKSKHVAKVKAYAQPVPVIQLMPKGQRKPNRRRKGIKAGRRFYQGAFVNKANGHYQAMQRKGKDRYPLVEPGILSVNIQKDTKRIMKVVSDRAMKGFFKRTLTHDLKFRLDKHKI